MPENILTGRDLAAERVRAGLRQADIAAVLGISHTRIAQVEWKLRPSPEFVTRYLAAIKVSRARG